jgi:IS5 family transposase
MVGLQYLKYAFNVSDENVVNQFLQNPYWQYFCGNEYFEHHIPCHPTSLVKWRQYIGVKGAEAMIRETIELAIRTKIAKPADFERINVDTTVQPKNVAPPTDAKLYNRARIVLVKAAQRVGVALKQTFTHLGRKTLLLHTRARHRKDFLQTRKTRRRLRTMLGRVIRDVERKMAVPSGRLSYVLQIAKKIHSQKYGENSKNKIYSVHAPEVRCIAKGKAHKKYEFGSKVSVATTQKSNWVVGVHSFSGNPFDGHTIFDALHQVKSLTGQWPKGAYCDRGYKGSEGYFFGTQIYRQGGTYGHDDKLTRRRIRRRAAVEPIIGHLKADHRMGRNFLLGFHGDQINALMAGCAFNMKKLLRAFFLSIFFWLFPPLQLT